MPVPEALPPSAAWRHHGAREGFEVVFFEGGRCTGRVSAVEGATAFVAAYEIDRDERGHTRRASVTARAGARREQTIVLESAGDGAWLVNGQTIAALDGCLDVDLEASVLTNALPVRRLRLAPDEAAQAPAVYVRAVDLGVQWLDQTYRRVGDGLSGARYAYAAPAFEFECVLEYDAAGLVVDYPGVATRVSVTD